MNKLWHDEAWEDYVYWQMPTCIVLGILAGYRLFPDLPVLRK
jgi:hypothetical protein